MSAFPETAILQTAGCFLFRDLGRHRLTPEQKGSVIIVKRVMAGDADDRIPLGIRESPLVLALDIDHADPGRRVNLGGHECVVIHGRFRGRYGPGEPAVDHEPGRKGDIGLEMPVPLPHLPHITRTDGIQPFEFLAPDRSVCRVGLDRYLWRVCLADLLFGHVEVRQKARSHQSGAPNPPCPARRYG